MPLAWEPESQTPDDVLVCVKPLKFHFTVSPTLIFVTQVPFWKELLQNQKLPTAIFVVVPALAVRMEVGPKCSQSSAPASARAAMATPAAENLSAADGSLNRMSIPPAL